MVTSKDIAKLAGVSHSTVSRAFRGDVKLRKETYDKVMAAASELNYTPNLMASNLKKRQSKTIGFIISDITNPFFMIIAQELENLLSAQGYRLMISFDEYDFDKQQRSIQAMIASQAEAIIFTPAKSKIKPGYIDNPNLHFIQLFSNEYPNLNSITFDDNHGAYIGTKYLLEHGHRRIMLLGGHNRVKGFYKACEEYGVDPIFPAECGFGSEQEVRLQVRNVFEKYRPTAIFAVGNWFGRPCYENIKELGLSIPGDMSLLIFDDLQWTQMLDISVISHPIKQLTKALVDKLTKILDGDSNISNVKFEPILLKRTSVKNIMQE
jgi:DNA-binding LacI/PurR family transcriptional regulator